MDVIIGRENISATVFVPYDCENRCNFCTTKHFYADLQPYEVTMENIAKNVRVLSRMGVTTFTLTGGEPLADLDRCKQIIECIKSATPFPESLIIYLNTSLPKVSGADNVVAFLNDPENHINGISVSRHRNTHELDLKLLRNVFTDDEIAQIKVPVRINCLVTRAIDPETFIKRWEPYPHIVINFRANYMKINSDNLHDQDAFFHKLNDTLTFDYHTQCNVCNTDVFHSESGQQINYHKGIFTTSILDEEENTLEINDFVINMFGDVYIDWIFEEQYALTGGIIRSIFERY